jgi:poly(A) polymerase
LSLPERWQAPQFPLGGNDVMGLGVPSGPRVGEALRALEGWWIAGDFTADEAALRRKLRELAGER